MQLRTWRAVLLSAALLLAVGIEAQGADRGVVGAWTLSGDARDSSGQGHDATNHNVQIPGDVFNGRDAYLEVADSAALDFGKGNFSIALRVSATEPFDDVLGDLISKFDPKTRRGFVLTFKSNTSGYNGPSNERLLFFGTDSETTGQWTECGRPGGKAHNSDALTVFNGDLYVGTVDGPEEADWAHVFRFKGDQNWEDCGRVGSGKIIGVYAMVVHNGELYAATASCHGGPTINTGDFARVYRYLGGTQWEDIGQPGEHYRVNSLASFGGKLFACSIHTGGKSGAVYVYEGDKKWKLHGDSPGRAHCMTIHDGQLYAAYPQGEVFAFEGDNWRHLGNPYASLEECNQLHAMGVYGGELYVGTWPFGKVSIWRDKKWFDVGRMGDATEIVGLAVYNGSFYGGTIPRAEVFRYDGPQKWTSLRKLFDPPKYDPNDKAQTEDWSRASSLAVYGDKMYVSTATCSRTKLAAPLPDEIRGRVYALKVGEGISYDRDLGVGWKHVVAVRDGSTLKLYIEGQLAASRKGAETLDVSNDAPLRIGFGPQSHFKGKISDVRLYDRALDDAEIRAISAKPQ